MKSLEIVQGYILCSEGDDYGDSIFEKFGREVHTEFIKLISRDELIRFAKKYPINHIYHHCLMSIEEEEI